MKHIDSRAELTSSNLAGCDAAYPTKQKIKQTRNTEPGTIPSASGLERKISTCKLRDENAHRIVARANNTYISVFAVGVPRFPRSFPVMPFRNVYFLICGTSLSVAMKPKRATVTYASSCEPTPSRSNVTSLPVAVCPEYSFSHRPIMGIGFCKRGIRSTTGGIRGQTARSQSQLRPECTPVIAYDSIRESESVCVSDNHFPQFNIDTSIVTMVEHSLVKQSVVRRCNSRFSAKRYAVCSVDIFCNAKTSHSSICHS
jgi:hypothetical protein